jgi:hypothetical protein
MDLSKLSRRRFLRNAAVAFPIGVVVLESTARAQDVPHVALDDPTAKALAYVEDVKNIDKAGVPGHARYEEGQTCANCIQLQGEAGAEWRPCNLFPGKLVAAAGWCSVWTKKPDA